VFGVGAVGMIMPSVGFVSLGCPKALVDSERILTQLRAEGYAIAPEYQSADLVGSIPAALLMMLFRRVWTPLVRR